LPFGFLAYIRTAKFQQIMSKVIAGIFTIVGGLMTLYFSFVMANTSWALDYNDPKLHMSMFQTGHLVPLVAGVLLLTVGLSFFFLAKEPNLN
jgi:hypothetical protein